MITASILLWINLHYRDHPMGPIVKFQGWPEDAIWNGFESGKPKSVIMWDQLMRNLGVGVSALILTASVLALVRQRQLPRLHLATKVMCLVTAVLLIFANTITGVRPLAMQTMKGSQVPMEKWWGWPFFAHGASTSVGGIVANLIVALALVVIVGFLVEHVARKVTRRK